MINRMILPLVVAAFALAYANGLSAQESTSIAAADFPDYVDEAALAGIDHVYAGPWEYFVGGGVAWLIGTVHYLPVVQYLGVPSGIALTLPIAALLYAVMTTVSAGRALLGRSSERRTATEIDLTDE